VSKPDPRPQPAQQTALPKPAPALKAKLYVGLRREPNGWVLSKLKDGREVDVYGPDELRLCLGVLRQQFEELVL
jgi:hypothetical protein